MNQTKILITGANSYVGTSFERWLKPFGERYIVDTVDTKNEKWKEISFAGYDVVIHVAGIAHVDAKKEMEGLYYAVNRDLAIKVGEKAKREGVSQFIFMSSMIVYGDSSAIGENFVITKDTLPSPANFYGDSKLQAEKGLLALADPLFCVTILRPPMIYGKGSKGNFPLLVSLAKKTPVFPNIQNQRSMLYINNLCEFIRLVIDWKKEGILFPQNAEYVSTAELVKKVSSMNQHKIWFTKLFNPVLRIASKRMVMLKKVFGNFVYEKEMSVYPDMPYQICDWQQSLQESEGNSN